MQTRSEGKLKPIAPNKLDEINIWCRAAAHPWSPRLILSSMPVHVATSSAPHPTLADNRARSWRAWPGVPRAAPTPHTGGKARPEATVCSVPCRKLQCGPMGFGNYRPCLLNQRATERISSRLPGPNLEVSGPHWRVGELFDVGPILVELGAMSTEVGPNLAVPGPLLVGFGRHRAKACRLRVRFGQVRARVADAEPMLVASNSRKKWSHSSQCWPIPLQIW